MYISGLKPRTPGPHNATGAGFFQFAGVLWGTDVSVTVDCSLGVTILPCYYPQPTEATHQDFRVITV